jgi:hypothetical protein
MRLIAFGDSNTYGDGLPGVGGHGLAGQYGYDQPSPMAWPQLLADRLNCECLNLAQPGYCNKEILASILKFQFEPTDHVVVLWTHVSRDVVFEDHNSHVKISAAKAKDSPKVRHYFMAHSEYDMQVTAWLQMSHAALYLQSQQVKFAMATYDTWDPALCIGKNYTSVNKTFRDVGVDFGSDNIHFGTQSHINLTEQMIKDLCW